MKCLQENGKRYRTDARAAQPAQRCSSVGDVDGIDSALSSPLLAVYWCPRCKHEIVRVVIHSMPSELTCERCGSPLTCTVQS